MEEKQQSKRQILSLSRKLRKAAMNKIFPFTQAERKEIQEKIAELEEQLRKIRGEKEYNQKRLVESPENKDCQSNIKIYGDVQKILEDVLNKIRLISPFKGLR